MTMFRVTEDHVRAFLNCPTKCYLILSGLVEPPTEPILLQSSISESYKKRCLQMLGARVGDDELADFSALQKYRSKDHPKFISNYAAETQKTKSVVDCLERDPTGVRPCVPIRFISREKLSDLDKVLLAFNAIPLSTNKKLPPVVGKIVHGEQQGTVTIGLSRYQKAAQSVVDTIHSLNVSQTPPPFALNKHCVECGFQLRCQQTALERDDLSLLSGISEKERTRFANQGIFTVKQLSYTYRPRRKPRRKIPAPDKNSFAIRALAIRLNKIHIVGKPELKLTGTPIYIDVEGIPDRDLYYLIGYTVIRDNASHREYFWANDVCGEKEMWFSFLRSIANIENPRLIHYGSYETIFIKRMISRYGSNNISLNFLEKLLKDALNVLKIIYAQIYFPTYGNSLKEIAKYLGFRWSNTYSSGFNALIWRLRWELSMESELKQRLITYNAEDCQALERVTSAIDRLCNTQPSDFSSIDRDIINVDSLRPVKSFYFGVQAFAVEELDQINKAAYWDYQRNRIHIRTSKRISSVVKKISRAQAKPPAIDKIIELKDDVGCCPKCGLVDIVENTRESKVVQDLKFGSTGVKRYTIKYLFTGYRCRKCGAWFHASGTRPWTRSEYGSEFRSFLVYEMIELRSPRTAIQDRLKQFFGLKVSQSVLHDQKTAASHYYQCTYDEILRKLVTGKLLHADETKINIERRDAYVWVFASLEEVAYVYTDTREGTMLHELLCDFRGVLVSDFYTAYDSIDCPQQKCLIHLIRDLNDDVLKQPFNEELLGLLNGFSTVLRTIIETIDRYGLKARHLHKHKVQAEKFLNCVSKTVYKTEIMNKYQKRFEKNALKLFTFLDYDGVPWNNNNAEHAIKPFAKLRHVIGGVSTPKGIREYLVLLSVCETCKYRGINFLDFLRSRETNIDALIKERPISDR
jgi:predicted RecB family nuclease